MRARVTTRVPRVRAAVRREVEAAVQAAVIDIEAGAKMRAPVGYTGFLRNSIRGHITGPMMGEVEVMAEYAEPVEFGHITRSGSHVAAQPFLLPAVAAARARFRVTAAIAVRRGVA